MTAKRFDDVLQGMAGRLPFRPFTVEIVGGQRFQIDHPAALAYRGGAAVFFSPGGVPIFFDHESVATVASDIVDADADPSA